MSVDFWRTSGREMAQPSVADGLSPAVLWVYRCASLGTLCVCEGKLMDGSMHNQELTDCCCTLFLPSSLPGELFYDSFCAQGVQLLPECAQLLLALQDGQRRYQGAASASVEYVAGLPFASNLVNG